MPCESMLQNTQIDLTSTVLSEGHTCHIGNAAAVANGLHQAAPRVPLRTEKQFKACNKREQEGDYVAGFGFTLGW